MKKRQRKKNLKKRLGNTIIYRPKGYGWSFPKAIDSKCGFRFDIKQVITNDEWIANIRASLDNNPIPPK